MVASCVGVTGFAASAHADEFLRPTPQRTTGPFYPVAHPRDEDADLTRVRGSCGRAEGQIIEVTGRVLNARREPSARAELDLWQADAFGRSAHPAELSTAPLDDAFQGFARLPTDRDGGFRLLTIKSWAYPADPSNGRRRTPHLHWMVTGRSDRMTTQMMFPDEPYNLGDIVLGRLPADRQPD
jgi:protocatechuate 3,4-dioxygenase beta subunit